jgi:hypothetical protein
MSYIKTYDQNTYEVTIEGDIISIKTWQLFFYLHSQNIKCENLLKIWWAERDLIC